MKKICLFLHGLNNGGVEAIIYRLIKNISPSSVSFDLVCFEKKSEKCFNEFKDVVSNIFFIPPKKKNFIKHLRSIKKIIRNGSYDVVHSNLFEWNSIPLYYAKKYGVPIRISHTHIVMPIGFLGRFILKINSYLIKRYSNTMIGCSREACDFLYGHGIGEVLPNGFEISNFFYNESYRESIRNYFQISKKTLVIGNVGRLSKQKNHSLMIEIAKKMKSQSKDAVFLCVGCGELEKDLKNAIIQNNLEKYFILAGETNKVEMFYSAFDIFCFPSLYEGLGIALVEAEISGLPCVVSSAIPKEAIVSKNVVVADCFADSIDDWTNYIFALQEFTLTSNRCKRDFFLFENAKKYDIKECALMIKRLYGIGD